MVAVYDHCHRSLKKMADEIAAGRQEMDREADLFVVGDRRRTEPVRSGSAFDDETVDDDDGDRDAAATTSPEDISSQDKLASGGGGGDDEDEEFDDDSKSHLRCGPDDDDDDDGGGEEATVMDTGIRGPYDAGKSPGEDDTPARDHRGGACGGRGPPDSDHDINDIDDINRDTDQQQLGATASAHHVVGDIIIGEDEILNPAGCAALKLEGLFPAPNAGSEIRWKAMSILLRDAHRSICAPDVSTRCKGLDENSMVDYCVCLTTLYQNLEEQKCWEAVANLQAFRTFFSGSTSDNQLQHVFRGRSLEVLQNIFYGGVGILPKARQCLVDPYPKKTTPNEPLADEVAAKRGACGGPQDHDINDTRQQGATASAAVGVISEDNILKPQAGYAREVHSCDMVKALSSSAILPPWLPGINDPLEQAQRNTCIQNMTEYEGVPLAPNETFEIQWVAMRIDIEECMASGLIPEDTIRSSGLDENSFQHMRQCAQKLQNNLFDNELPECLCNLRGFRRLFSKSDDPVLRQAFRGPPAEVLQNIYFGGIGILPEDRMLADDPFHHSQEVKYPYMEH